MTSNYRNERFRCQAYGGKLLHFKIKYVVTVNLSKLKTSLDNLKRSDHFAR